MNNLSVNGSSRAIRPKLADMVTREFSKVRDLCVSLQVQELYLFGSAVDGRFSPDRSDIDFLVDFGNLETSLLDKCWLKLWLALQGVYARPVDLILASNVTDPGFKRYLSLYKVPVFSNLNNL